MTVATHTMISWCLGNFDIPAYTDNLVYLKPIYAQITIVLYLILTMITLLNFVIAILSNTYEILSFKSEAIYLSSIVILDHQNGHDSKISSIVNCPIGLNLFFIPLYPIIVLLKSKTLN